MPDGDPIEIPTEDLANFNGCISVRDLGALALNECRMPTQLSHPRLERAARPRAAEKEQHRQYFVAQVGMQFAQGAFAFQVKCHLHHGFDFFLAEIQIADQVAASQIGLHTSSPCLISNALRHTQLSKTNMIQPSSR